ncbi:hypothetical protein DFJ63DRAFT_335676 [Scheffersomyces coipomensis]|uniref:uncharacterized protein n=1 Tax=Scheffersomyces coipomensis TaxID=1788519 RepID=UPI00315CE509
MSSIEEKDPNTQLHEHVNLFRGKIGDDIMNSTQKYLRNPFQDLNKLSKQGINLLGEGYIYFAIRAAFKGRSRTERLKELSACPDWKLINKFYAVIGFGVSVGFDIDLLGFGFGFNCYSWFGKGIKCNYV